MSNKRLTVLGTGCFLAMSMHSALALSNPDRSLLTLNASSPEVVSSKTQYIVQLKGAPAANRSSDNTIPDRFDGVLNNVKYDANSAASIAYRQELVNKQNSVMQSVGVTDAIYTYEHSFNGFAATLSESQVTKLKNDPDVLNVWPNELLQMDTANTPEFLGLTAPGGLHTLGTKGENIIIGVVDSGVWPENPSLRDDMSGNEFGPIVDSRPDWAGTCDTGTDEAFSCNNKLIGARYFNESFVENGTILAGEFDSPRDADGHGTHTMTTAGGNEGVTATLQGIDVGTISGIAPRARVAAYKVCWNGSAEGNSGCSTGDSVAAIDAAVADGVDVINFSISGSSTAMTDPVHVAFFNASRGGVFNALSAGNSGPTAQTVAHNVPWVTTVGASTYDGEAALVGSILEVSYIESTENLFSIPGAITTAIPEEGLAGELVAVTPIEACDDGLTNAPGELDGKVALIARGSCNFSVKILNAQDAGAVGVVVYSTSNTAIAMGGESTGITIPGVMISLDDGLELASLVDELDVSVNFTNEGISGSAPQIGNQMADFSSKGESLATADIIKPDITAPGVTILAGTSGSQIDTGTVGESYAFLSGTSMSSPHIAGMAALIREAQPDWSPAAVKSALMTTAYQDVTKEDGSTPADPFDFGAGHAVPNSAVDPGLIYDATFNDYYAFLCGAGDADFVESDYFAGACSALEGAGFPLDASDLNIASIAIEALAETQTIRRFVNNVSDSVEYTATVDAPAGVDVVVSVLDWDTNSFVEASTMGFNDSGLGVYELTFSKNDAAVIDEWVFGSITWSDGAHNVRSPIALKPANPPVITVPETVSIDATSTSARVTIPVDVNYSGRFYVQGLGLDEPEVTVAEVAQDADQTFAFNEAGLGFYFVDVPEGTRIAKFGLFSADQDSADVDLDLYVYACPSFSCTDVGNSQNGGSDESVVLIDPQPLADLGNSNIYVVFVHGWNLNGAESVLAPLNVWTVNESGSTQHMTVRASSVARVGRTNSVYLSASELESGKNYLGGIIYTDENGTENGLTVVEVNAQ